MAPIATADLQTSNLKPDSGVYPPLDADVRIKKLWAQHVDPQSSRYAVYIGKTFVGDSDLIGEDIQIQN